MSKVTVIQCDIADLKEALLQLDKVPVIVDPGKPYKCSPEEKLQMEQAKVKIKSPKPQDSKEEILAMASQGLFATEIGKRLGLNPNSVKSFIYAERAKANKKALENYPSPEARAWINGTTKTPRTDLEPAKVESCKVQAEKAALVTTANPDRPYVDHSDATPGNLKEPILKETRQDKIDHVILAGSKKDYSHTQIAAKIGYLLGCPWTSDDVSKRLQELREGDKP